MIDKVLMIICVIIVLAGIKGYINYTKYKKDEESINKILDFFKKNGKDGIKPKDIPKDIVATGYINWMKKDELLTYKNGKYYLNK